MKRVCFKPFRRMSVLAILAPGFLIMTHAKAQSAAAAFNGYNSAYLVQNGQTFYADTIGSTTAQREWPEALDIDVALDAYRHSRTQSGLNLVTSLLNSLTYYNSAGGPYDNWQTDGWDDNLEWMVNAYLQGYLLTGNTAYLSQAEAGWNNAYNLGWDTTYNNGGIWEERPQNSSKCSLSNDPFIWEGAELTLATQDGSYLSKAENVYNWMRTTLVNTTKNTNGLGAPGQVNGCVFTNGSLGASDNVYDAGSFLEAAVQLYKLTGNAQYSSDALLTINHIIGQGATLPYKGSGESGHQWAYWFTRGLSDYANQTGTWGSYQSYLQGNANQAWNERNTTYNITWNDWLNPTDLSGDSSNPGNDPEEMSSAAAVWQHLPPTALNLSGTWQVQNVNSGMAMAVSGSSNASNAAVVQSPFSSGQAGAEWQFVPTSGGYYHIINVNSKLAVNVRGGSAQKGAVIIQYAPQGMNPGNDQWYPVQNPDGSYSFYNLNSYQALEVPAFSTTSGTQLGQYFGNFGKNQEWKLIPE